MTLLWAKAGVDLDQKIQRFLASEDVILDRELFLYDLRATRAHTEGLGRIGVLTRADLDALLRELDVLESLWASGAFILDDRFEDGHSAIEAHLTERLGDAGKRVHTGRSRNDQVQVALRLWMKAQLALLERQCLDSAAAFLDRADADAMTPMPGYTHLQRAVPSSVGLWMGAFAESFLDDAALARAVRAWLDACPLGTAAGYGVNLPLPREEVSAALGFGRVQISPMYVQNSRGKFEVEVLGVMLQAMLDVRRFAWDLSLYTTAEFGLVSLPARYTTGSSIMPNKRNPDVVELLRAALAPVQGAQAEVLAVLSLPSGYQRDLQATKGPLLRGVKAALDALALLPDLVRAVEWNREAMRAAISPDMYATDRAVELTASGVPFRDAYRQAAAELGESSERQPEDSLSARASLGGCADLGLGALRARLDAQQAALTP
jgi:argininosuccinate lyase